MQISEYMEGVFQQVYKMKDPGSVDSVWFQFLSVCLEDGMSMATGNRLISIFSTLQPNRIEGLSMEFLMSSIENWSCVPSCLTRIGICSECSIENRPGQVFCLHCLKKKKLIRLIKGCNVSGCPGKKENEDEVFDENQTDQYKQATCFHSRQSFTGSGIIYHSMISIVGDLVSSGLFFRLCNTTYKDMAITAALCRRNKEMSNILGTNALSAYEYLQVPIVDYLKACSQEIQASGDHVEALTTGLEECTKSGSIEDKLYYDLPNLSKEDMEKLKTEYQKEDKTINSEEDDLMENPLEAEKETEFNEVLMSEEDMEEEEANETVTNGPSDGTVPNGPSDTTVQAEGSKEATPNDTLPDKATEAVPERRYDTRSATERKKNPYREAPSGVEQMEDDEEEWNKEKKENTKRAPKVTPKTYRYSQRDVELLIRSFYNDIQLPETCQKEQQSQSEKQSGNQGKKGKSKNLRKGKSKNSRKGKSGKTKELPQATVSEESNGEKTMEESDDEKRVDTLLQELKCKPAEKLVAATALSMWLNWNSPGRTNKTLYYNLLMHLKSTLSENQQNRVNDIANTRRFNGEGLRLVEAQCSNAVNGGNTNVAEEESFEHKKESDYSRIRWERPTNDVPITDHIILLDLYVDSVVSYMASKKNNSLFVVNLMINNAPATERNTKAFSHFLAIIQDKKDIKGVLRFIIKDLSITGKNGIFLFHDGQWMHIRWAVTGIHGDTVAQEEMEDMANKKFMWHPCVFDHTCECSNVSGSEGLCLPQTVRAKIGQLGSWRLPPRNFRRFSKDSPYRFLSLTDVQESSSGHGTPIELTREGKALRKLMVHLGNPSVWIPPAVSTSDTLSFREELLATSIRKSVQDTGESLHIDPSRIKECLEGIEAAYASKSTNKSSINPLCMDDYIPVPKENRYALDAMHHIPNLGSCLYRGLHSTYTKSAKTMDTSLKDLIQKTKKDMHVPNWVRHIAMERIRLLRQPWDKDYRNYEFTMERMKGQSFSTENQTPPPSWLKPSIITPRGFKKTRNHDDILFLLCYFDYVFQDSMRVPFVFAAKQVIDCLGYLYNNVNDLNRAASVQTILDFFSDFLLAIMPPSFGTISLHNSTHYLDSMKCFGPMKNHDCFGNERLLQLVKGNTVTSRNPILTIEKRMFLFEECQILQRAKLKAESKCVARSEEITNDASHLLGPLQERLKELTLENLTDDRAYSINDSVPFSTSVDSILLNKPRCYPVNRDFWLEEQSAKYYTKIQFNGENCCSATPGDTIDTKWLKENSKAIGYLKLIDGKIAMFIVTGYVVQRVGSSLYPQAICKYIETDSSSSFIDTQHKRMCKESYTTVNLKTCLISLYKLTMNRAFALYYEKSKRCGFALQSLCSRQSKPIEKERLFYPEAVKYHTRQQDRNQGVHSIVCSKERQGIKILRGNDASFVAWKETESFLAWKETESFVYFSGE